MEGVTNYVQRLNSRGTRQKAYIFQTTHGPAPGVNAFFLKMPLLPFATSRRVLQPADLAFGRALNSRFAYDTSWLLNQRKQGGSGSKHTGLSLVPRPSETSPLSPAQYKRCGLKHLPAGPDIPALAPEFTLEKSGRQPSQSVLSKHPKHWAIPCKTAVTCCFCFVSHFRGVSPRDVPT